MIGIDIWASYCDY